MLLPAERERDREKLIKSAKTKEKRRRVEEEDEAAALGGVTAHAQ